MGFFFSQIERDIQKGAASRLPLQSLHDLECAACPLNDAPHAIHPKMAPTGVAHPLVYLLGDAPGVLEDTHGKHFVDRAGQLLRHTLPAGLLSHARLNTCIRTRPPTKRDPLLVELTCCAPSVEKDIATSKPRAIFGFGPIPLQRIGGAAVSGGILLWRGRRFPVTIQGHTCWYYPMLHPSYLFERGMKVPNQPTLPNRMFLEIFERDLQRAWKHVQADDHAMVSLEADYRTGIEYPTDLTRIEKCLWSWDKTDAVVALDFETTCLRPYNGEILSVAIGTTTQTLAIPLHHPQAPWTPEHKTHLLHILRTWLTDSQCIKVAHNLLFELEWILAKFGNHAVQRQWWHDTVAQAYCLDERTGGMSLDMLIQQHFGFSLKSLTPVDRKVLQTTPLPLVLEYNGLDTKWTAQLFEVQRSLLEQAKLTPVYNEQRRRIPTLVHSQFKGLHVNTDKVQEFSTQIQTQLQTVEAEIQALDVAEEFREVQMTELKIRSPKDLGFVFDQLLDCPEVRTKEGKISTDEKYLATIDHPLAKSLLEFRELDRLHSTYIEPFLPGGEQIHTDGLIHTSFSCNFTATRRLSSRSPNIQNFPKHGNAWVRAEICAPPDYYLVSLDYGQIEFRVLAMASKDRRIIEALNNRYDVHMDWARRYAEKFPQLVGGVKYLDDADALKKLRSQIKNTVVFPLFFGSSVKGVAESLSLSETLIEPLVGEFWDEFSGVAAWQQKIMARYSRTGYVETLTGFRRHGPLTKNKIINTPIQGTASDIVVDAMNRLSERAESLDCIIYQPVMNIHDDLEFYIPQQDLETYLEPIIEEMLFCQFPFINVPLSLEVAVGTDWGNLEEMAVFYSDEWNQPHEPSVPIIRIDSDPVSTARV
jgi:uracil-DNA glycosylase family 4